MDSVLGEIRAELRESVDAKTKASSQMFFKEKVTAYGVRTKTVNIIAKKYYKKLNGNAEVFKVCEELFRSGMLEEAFIAGKMADYVGVYDEADFEVFERWVNLYVDNWATCDTLCNHANGSFVTAYPGYVERLVEWTGSENMWVRRAAAVSLVVPAKKGLFLEEAFRIADLLMDEKEDLVQKGFGWLLKEESRTKQKEVYEYVLSKRAVMPRTALRYAIELMPQDMRKEAMRRVTA